MKQVTLKVLAITLIALLLNIAAPTSASPDLSAMTSSERSEYLRESSGGSVFYVNSIIGDSGDTNPGNEVCDTGAGVCTLRAAIEEANGDNDHDIIRFAFTSPTIIKPNSALPEIENSVTIDGVTDNPSTCPTSSVPANLLVTLSGESATGFWAGIGLSFSTGSADGSSIRGLNIVQWTQRGISLKGSQTSGITLYLEDVRVTCNHIGIDNVNTPAIGNRPGIYLDRYLSNVIVGGTNPGDRNVISGNTGSGIKIFQTVSGRDYQVLGNYIGTTTFGNSGLPNAGDGIEASINVEELLQIGTVDAGNLIAYNGQAGISLKSSIDPADDSNLQIIGNTIHDNDASGIDDSRSLYSSTTNAAKPTIRRNEIYDNGELGIDHGTDGVTPPTANNDNNFPKLLTISNGDQLRFYFQVFFSPGKTYQFDVFHSDTCDPSGYGEGTTYVESFSVVPPSPFSTIDYTLANTLPFGKFITVTATNPGGETSEFSNCLRENTTFTIDSVENESDVTPGNGTCASNFNECTLRAALEEIDAQASSGPFTIYFDIASSNPIEMSTPLPTINKPVTIDATTQANALCATEESNPTGLRVLSGRLLSSGSGLVFGSGSDGSSVSGLAIEQFPTDGIQSASDDNWFFCNILGNAVAGSATNGDDGIQITGNGNTVGGAEPFRRNLIVRNAESGVEIVGGGQFNNVLGNYIGTDGDAVRANAIGVRIGGFGLGNNIGAQALADDKGVIAVRGHNVIAGNTSHGVHLTTTGVNTNVGGNLIGVKPDGVTPLGNGGAGIWAESPMVQIGLTRGQFGQLYEVPNVIGASGAAGIGVLADDAWVMGNFIGVPMTGTTTIGNVGNGIYITSDDARIHNNVIGSNGGHGIRATSSSTSNEFYGNVIGLAADGSTARGNSLYGMRIQGDSNTVGNVDDGTTWNTIAHNGGYGIYLDENVNFTVIAGSTIRDNGDDGIAVDPLSSINYFERNAIYDNVGMAIDINNDGGVIANDELDMDTGSNTLINRIEIISADSDDGKIHIIYHGTPNHLHFLEFYTNPGCSGSGAGQGQTPIKSEITFTTNGDGDWEESGGLGEFVSGDGITALVTNSFSGSAPNSTSEFSDCVVATGAPPTAIGLDAVSAESFPKPQHIITMLATLLGAVTLRCYKRFPRRVH